MSESAGQFARLKMMHESAILLKEGGRSLVLLPAFTFTAAGRDETMDLLLVPFEHSGYTTRLFFERRIAGRGNNWTQHRVVDHTWWAPSWNNVPASSSWPDMLCAHLRAVA